MSVKHLIEHLTVKQLINYGKNVANKDVEDSTAKRILLEIFNELDEREASNK